MNQRSRAWPFAAVAVEADLHRAGEERELAPEAGERRQAGEAEHEHGDGQRRRPGRCGRCRPGRRPCRSAFARRRGRRARRTCRRSRTNRRRRRTASRRRRRRSGSSPSAPRSRPRGRRACSRRARSTSRPACGGCCLARGPTTLPSVIVTSARISGTRTAGLFGARHGDRDDAHQGGDAGDLRQHGQEAGVGVRRALVDVGSVKVKRHGGDLEAEAGDDRARAPVARRAGTPSSAGELLRERGLNDVEPGRCRRRRRGS